MADSSLLSSILSGNDPLAPQMVPAYVAAQQTQQMLDPNYGMNQGPFGALARVLAGATGYGQGGLQSAVQNVTNQRTANLPELAKVYATDDPYKTIAANPGAYSSQTLANLLAGTNPDTVAQSRLRGAQAAYLQAQGALAARAGQPMPAPEYGSPGAAPAPAAATAANGLPPAKPGAVAIPSSFNPRYPGQPAAAEAEPDVSGILSMPPEMRPAAVAAMNPKEKAALAVLVAKMKARASMAPVAGGVNAAARP